MSWHSNKRSHRSSKPPQRTTRSDGRKRSGHSSYRSWRRIKHARRRAPSLPDAKPAVQTQLATAEQALVEHERVAGTLTEPPLGWSRVSQETDILAIANAPIQGTVRDGWARKMAALKAELGQLSAAESRAPPCASRSSSQTIRSRSRSPRACGSPASVSTTSSPFWTALGGEKRSTAPEDRSPASRRPPRRYWGTAWRSTVVNTSLLTPGPSLAGPAPRQPMDVLRLAPESQRTVAPDANQHDKAREISRTATQLYLQTNSNSVWTAIHTHLQRTSWPAATDQFTWLQPHAFVDAVIAAFHDKVMAGAEAGDINLTQLDALLYPLSLHNEIAGLNPGGIKNDRQVFQPSKQWVPAIGLPIGQLVQAALVPSVVRMSERFVDGTNARAEQAKRESIRLKAKDLITSSPLDRIVAGGSWCPER